MWGELDHEMAEDFIHKVFKTLYGDHYENYSYDDCLDFALLNVVLPQIEKLPPIQLKSINDFSRGRIATNFYKKDFDDDFNSQQDLVEIKKLIDFINMHKEEGDKLNPNKWKLTMDFIQIIIIYVKSRKHFKNLNITRDFNDKIILSNWEYKPLNESKRISGIIKERIIEDS